MTKLGGWQRLGLVLAALWCIAVTSFVFIEYREVLSERANNLSLPSPPNGFVMDPKTHAYFYSWQPVDLLAQGASSYTRDFGFNIYRFFGSAAWSNLRNVGERIGGRVGHSRF